jgi:hypothetical protein
MFTDHIPKARFTDCTQVTEAEGGEKNVILETVLIA